ncbi:MAG: hypothetical protein MRY76_05845 [Pseudomonadales bacterium]|nr:hypothetical protein [Pseudomonadales bacterium]
MIERLQLIASFLARHQGVILFLVLAFAALFAYSLFQFQGDGDSLMMPALAGFCWALTLLAYARLFAEIPEKPGKHHGFLQRQSLRLRRAAMQLLALLLILVGLAVLVLSYQLLRTWSMN